MKIAILGAGKMGGFLFDQLSEGHTVSLYGPTHEKARKIAGENAMKSLEELSSVSPELLVNAASLRNTITAFDSALPYLPKNCALCDITSVKAGLPEYYKKCGRKFVSLHPMFGPTFAKMGEISGENLAVISESDARLGKLFEEWGKALKLNVFHYSFAEHDKMMAYSLTTPFALSLVFAACMGEKTVPGTTFKKHMAVSRGLLSEDDSLLSEILFNKHSAEQISKISSRLELLKHIINGRDYEEAGKFFGKLRKNISD